MLEYGLFACINGLEDYIRSDMTAAIESCIMKQSIKKWKMMMHFSILAFGTPPPLKRICSLSTLASNWAVPKWLRPVKHCQDDPLHLRLPPQMLSVQHREHILSLQYYLRQALFTSIGRVQEVESDLRVTSGLFWYPKSIFSNFGLPISKLHLNKNVQHLSKLGNC